MSPALDILCCRMIAYGMEHLGELVGVGVRYMDDVFGMYAVSNDAEEEMVSEHFGRVAVSYTPPTGAQCGASLRLTSVLRVNGEQRWRKLQLLSMEPCCPSPEEW